MVVRSGFRGRVGCDGAVYCLGRAHRQIRETLDLPAAHGGEYQASVRTFCVTGGNSPGADIRSAGAWAFPPLATTQILYARVDEGLAETGAAASAGIGRLRSKRERQLIWGR